ncbi:MAG TPA: tape measure protein [Armatimonadota bacterium]|jgi:tape measure domain-containing protein
MATEELKTVFSASGHGETVGAFNRLGSAARTAGAAMAGIGAAAIGGMTALTMGAINVAGQFQTLQVRLNSVMGSAKAGKDAFAWATDFAKKTPFELTDVVDAMTTMKALGLDAKRDLGTIGDAASALGLGADGVRRITMQLAQMKNIGKASMEDLRVLAEAGIPVFDILQQKFHLTGNQMKRIGELGLAAQPVINALLNGMDARFGGGMAAQMSTLTGKLSNLKDAWNQLLARIGDKLMPQLLSALDKLTAFIGSEGATNMGLKFASYIAAAVDTLWNKGKEIADMLLNRIELPTWALTLLKAFWELARFLSNNVLFAAQMIARLNPFSGMSDEIKGFRASANAEFEARSKDIDSRYARSQADSAKREGIWDMFKESQKRYLNMFTNGQGGFIAPEIKGGRGGTRPVDMTGMPGYGAGKGTGTAERFLLGGGEFAQKWAKGVATATGKGTPAITLTWRNQSTDSIVKGVQSGIKDVLQQMFTDRATLSVLKAALSGV